MHGKGAPALAVFFLWAFFNVLKKLMQKNVENLIERIENQLKQLESYTYDESHVKTLELEQKNYRRL